MIQIKGLTFKQTCSACPEQYDVFDQYGNQVGYIRLRWGYLRCDYPKYNGDLIYEADIGNSLTGCFKDEEERMVHLNIIVDKILERMSSNMCSTCDFTKYTEHEQEIRGKTIKFLKDDHTSLGISCDINGQNYKINDFTIYRCPTCGRKLY